MYEADNSRLQRTVMLLIFCQLGCSAGTSMPGDNSGGDVVEPGIATRPSNTTCLAGARPGTTAGTLDSEPVFAGVAGISFVTDLQRAPAAFAGWLLANQDGRVLYIADGSTTAEELVNLSTLAGTDFASGGEKGLLGLAVDPAFPSIARPERMRFYLSYTGLSRSYITRFDATMQTGVSPQVSQISAEETLISVRQPYGTHNGGALRFAANGLLYATYGDGGSARGPHCAAQNFTTLLGKLLRIDVSGETGYRIPESNPFYWQTDAETTPSALCSELAGADPVTDQPDTSYTAPCPEIFAWGLRNPFRISIDRVANTVWLGDVGQDFAEDVDRIDADLPPSRALDSSTRNFGWPLFEGLREWDNAACQVLLNSPTARPEIVAAPPAYYYLHQNTSRWGVTVGPVYRGSALGGSFSGKLLFSDFGTGEFWAAASPYLETAPVDSSALSLATLPRIYGFAQDDNGEVYVLGGGVRRLVLSGGTVTTLPEMLSDTGCVDALDAKQPAAGLIPYNVNSRLWSDGALKKRFMALPNGMQIDRSGNCGSLNEVDCLARGDWDFPRGTVLVKTFAVAQTLVETRLFMRHDDGGWAGYTYVWNDEQTDAVLIDASETKNGWRAPSRAECLGCHTQAAGRALGPTTAQLNRDFTYPSGITSNQLSTFEHLDLFEQPLLADPKDLPRLADPSIDDGRATLGQRSRAYLDANCSFCHRPGGFGPTLDARFTTPFTAGQICDQDSVLEPGKKLLAPGVSTDSVISQRMHLLGVGQMPPAPFARSTVDIAATTLIDQWIDSLNGCP